MRLASQSGSSFTLQILGYEFPALENKEYDSNWLNIEIHAEHPKGRWRAVDPSLLTYEVDQLVCWLDAIRRGDPVEPEISFLEPNLRFEVRADQMFRIYIDLELRPSWAPAFGPGREDLYVEFPLSELDLVSAVADLREQLQKYPQRTKA